MKVPAVAGLFRQRRAAFGHDHVRRKVKLNFRRIWRRGRGGFRLRRIYNRCGQRVPKRLGVGSLKILAAGVLGKARHLLALLGGQREAHNMRREIHAGLLQLIAQRARIGVAGFEAVGDENDRRLLFGIFEFLSCPLHSFRQRRLALWIDPVRRRDDCRAGACGRRHQQLDVRARSLLAVAIGHQPKLAFRRQRAKHACHRLLGDLNARLPVNLRPHRAGSVEDDDGFVSGMRRSKRGGEEAKSAQKTLEECHVNFPS